MNRISAVFLLMAALVAAIATADALELKDGRIIQGQYQGGSQSTLRFEVEGSVEVIPVDEVLALTFSGSGAAAAAAAAEVTHPRSSEYRVQEQITVRAGTTFLVQTIESVDSRSRQGDVFESILGADLVVDGTVVAAKGSRVYGRVASVTSGGRVSGRAELRLELTDIEIDGELQPIVTSDFRLAGKSQGTLRNSVLGAALGALLDGSDGAKKGALVGFGASLLIPGKQAKIPAGTLIEFRLHHSFTTEASAARA